MMASSGFPTDDYTPHGYLANPFAVAHSWAEGAGGSVRTSREYVGVGWHLPWPQNAKASVELVVMLAGDGQRFERRADFASAGLTSPHHSATLFELRWEALGRRWEASFALLGRDALGLEVKWTPSSPTNPSGREAVRPHAALRIGLVGGTATSRVTDPVSRIDLGEPYGRWELLMEGARVGTSASGSEYATVRRVWADADEAPVPEQVPAALLSPSGRAPGAPRRARPLPAQFHSVAMGRGLRRRAIESLVLDALARVRTADDAFWAGAARLEGDWPDSWRRGWVYDIETTRMCVYPPGGIFTDVWPAWMVQWPRAVVAEGTLDMARLGYASPELALRATLSLFRDAEAPNVPCVFQHGEPNMVAADGAICGTSPAWCIPFYNLERLFAQTLDGRWLAEIYPYLARYVEWWLAERTDADGWAVYKCTWEAGEDDNPRLDPERRGDNVVSAFVRPVELQATMALSAGVLARFATVLGKQDDATRWREVEAHYLARTRELLDPVEGRFRDWDARNGRFLAPSGEDNYWGVDTCRYSALAFTPLLAGLTDEAIRAGLRRELQQYAGPPWTLWASWSYVVLEAAPLTGDLGFAGRIAAEIVGRVYDELDVRDPRGPDHPTPGVAREYWPLDLDTWKSCEGYGWGANTASLLVRQIFGFFEGPYLPEPNEDGAVDSFVAAAASGGWRTDILTFDLRPSLPGRLLVAGRAYWLTGLPYRGGRLSIGYRVVDSSGALTILVSADHPTHCRVSAPDGRALYASDQVQERHELSGRNGAAYRVELRQAPA
jgi:hypothetical protein